MILGDGSKLLKLAAESPHAVTATMSDLDNIGDLVKSRAVIEDNNLGGKHKFTSANIDVADISFTCNLDSDSAATMSTAFDANEKGLYAIELGDESVTAFNSQFEASVSSFGVTGIAPDGSVKASVTLTIDSATIADYTPASSGSGTDEN